MGSSNTLKLERRKRKKLKRLSFKVGDTGKKDQNDDRNGILSDGDGSSICSGTSNELDSLIEQEPVKLSSTSCGEVLVNTKEEETQNVLAIDCEMVGVGEDKKSALARCSIVDYDGKVIYDSYVKPEDIITDFRTQWSGIRPKHMRKAISFHAAKKQVKRLIKNHIVVGHSLQSDLNVLKLTHPPYLIRDTSKYVPLRVLAGLPSNITPSLKRLTLNLLQTDIQNNEHCSVVDAISSLNLYKLFEKRWENEIQGNGENGSYLCDAYWPSWTSMS